MNSPHKFEEILDSAISRNFKVLSKAHTCMKFGEMVVLDDMFKEEILQAHANIEALRLIGNKYYAKTSNRRIS